MRIPGIVQIAAAPDGETISEAIRTHLSKTVAVAAGTCPTVLPLAHENAVLVFVLTGQAIADPAIRAYATLAADSRFPILPVVPTRTSFDFRTLTGELAFLGRLNAIGWDDGDTPGAAVLTAIRRHLGLEPFQRDCRLFVSYTGAARGPRRPRRSIATSGAADSTPFWTPRTRPSNRARRSSPASMRRSRKRTSCSSSTRPTRQTRPGSGRKSAAP